MQYREVMAILCPCMHQTVLLMSDLDLRNVELVLLGDCVAPICVRFAAA